MEREKSVINECNISECHMFDVYVLDDKNNPVRPALEMFIDPITRSVRGGDLRMGKRIRAFQTPPGTSQLSIFEMVKEQHEKASAREAVEPGSLNINLRLREEISRGLKQCNYSRYEVASRMSELLGVEITKSQLDSWTAESKEFHRFPAEYLPAFIMVTGYKQPLAMMAQMIKCYLFESEEALLAELGKIDRQKRELLNKEKAVIDLLNTMQTKHSITPAG